MSEISLKKALINKQNRLSEKDKEKNKINLRSISYFVYPKVKDLQKGILIILGSFCAILIKNQSFLLNISDIFRIFFIWFITDFLIYQARFQWNDIRGLQNDKEEDKNDRLHGLFKNDVKGIFLSIVIFDK